MSPLDPSSIVPFRAGTPRRRSWRDRIAAGAAEAAVSLALNLAVMVALVHLAFPRVLDKSEPHAVEVDLVPDVPKAAGGGAAQKPASSPPAAGSPADPAAGGGKTEPSPTEPKPSAPAQTGSAEAKPPPKAAEPAAAEPGTPSPPAEAGKPETPTEVPPGAASSATPAPIEGDQNPAPRLVEAPLAPRSGETQAETNVVANAEPRPADTPQPVERPRAPAPAALATPDPGAEALPPLSTAAETPHPAPAPTAAEKRQAENTAKLAAVLPFAQGLPPTFARTALAGTGEAAVQKYRGAVYGQFRKADDLMEQARAAHLRGQTVVEFSIDDAGALTGLRVAVSSGQPEVDRLAEDIVRRAAPFPPPPPGGQHVFSPAIRLGLDE